MKNMMLPIKLTGLALVTLFVQMAYAGDEAGVTPYRPSVSSPAQLPLAGQLELEIGVLRNKMDDARRDSLPYQFKLAFDTEWGILIGGEARVTNQDEFGYRQKGAGDTTLVIKRAFLIDDVTAFGLELGSKLATAKQTIGSGKTDYSLNAVFSQDIDKLHMDANANVTRLGMQESGVSRMALGVAISFSMPLNDQWQAILEPSGLRQSGKPASAQLLAALAYSPDRHLTLDIGLAKGLNKASQTYSLFAGLVMPIGKLW